MGSGMNRVRLFRKAMAANPSPAFIKDRRNRYRYMNAAAMQLVGVESVGVGVRDRDLFPHVLEHIIESERGVWKGDALALEEHVVAAGQRFDAFTTKWLVEDASEEPLMFGVSHLHRLSPRPPDDSDVVARVDPVAYLEHETKNCLQALGSAALLLRRRVAPEDAKLVEVIERQLQHIRQLFEQADPALDGPSHSELVTSVCVGAVVREAVATVELAFQRAVEVDVDGELQVKVDSTRLKQVLVNLLHNALRHTPRGSVLVRAARAASWIIIEVQDNGRGMTRQTLDRVFEQSFKDDSNGRGLGLWLVERFVERMGGAVEVDSAGRGRGTTVRLQLPATP